MISLKSQIYQQIRTGIELTCVASLRLFQNVFISDASSVVLVFAAMYDSFPSSMDFFTHTVGAKDQFYHLRLLLWVQVRPGEPGVVSWSEDIVSEIVRDRVELTFYLCLFLSGKFVHFGFKLVPVIGEIEEWVVVVLADVSSLLQFAFDMSASHF